MTSAELIEITNIVYSILILLGCIGFLCIDWESLNDKFK